MMIIKSYIFNLISPIFLISIGIAIVMSILLSMFFAQKLPDFKKNKPKFYTYILSCAFIYALVALLGYSKLFNNSHLHEFIFYQICSLFLGTIHVLLYRDYLNKFGSVKMWHELFFTLITVFYSIIPFLFIYTFLNGISFMFVVLGHFVMFFIPTFLNATFNEAIGIPAKVFKLWQFPENYKELFGVSDEEMRDLIVVSFLITQDNQSHVYRNFRAKGPIRLDFGRLFHNFVQDYNNRHSENPIEVINKDGDLENWVFFLRPKWYQSAQYIDPELTLYMNNIEENSVIICQRADRLTRVLKEEPIYEYK